MDDAIDCAKKGDLQFFKDAQVDILLNARDSNGGTVLSIVVDSKRVDCCKEICKRCPLLLCHQQYEGGYTPLHIAASKGNRDILKLLISTCDKADQEGDRAGKPKTITLTDNEGQNFFHHVVKSERVRMVQHVLKMEEITSDVLNGRDNLERTPWDLAVESRKKNIISCLLENDRVDTKLTVTKNLHWVVEERNFGMMNLFLETNDDFLMNIDLEVIQNSEDILFKAAEKNHLFLCEKLYERCPSLIIHQSTGGRTALHQAASKGKPDMVEFLTAPGAKSYNDKGENIPQKLLTMVDNKGNTALHIAVLYNRVGALKLLIKADSNKELLRAVGEKSKSGIARLLIEADPGTDFNYGANSDGKTPLLIAIDKAELQNNRGMLKLILELQPTQSTVSVNKNGWTALHYSVSREFLRSIGDIIQSCPESSKVADKEGQNFFHHAVKSGNVNMVKNILGMEEITKEVLNSKDNLGRTPWDVAAESQNESMISCLHKDDRVNKKLSVTKNLNWVVEKHNIVMLELFMRENVDFLMNIEEEVFLNSKNEEAETILFKAAQEEQSLLCAKLCERCPSLVRHPNKGGRTVLHHAALRGSLIVLPVLIKACRSLHEVNRCDDHPLMFVDDQGDTALHMAVRNHKLEAVKLLVEADLDYKYEVNKSGDTPIMISIREARSNKNKFDSGEIRRLLFKMQPKQTMEHRGENGWTLLHQASSEEDLSIIEDIIEFCTGYLDVEDDNGKNFLHIAAQLEKIEVVRLVLRAKDVPDNVLYNQDKDGNTPMHIAVKTGYMPLMECFLSDLRFSKKMPLPEENGWTVLHQATSEGDLSIIKKFIKFWPDYFALEDKEGKNCLHIAAEFEKVEIVKQVLRATDIPDDVLNHRDEDGNTPFHIAALTGNEPLTRCFLFDTRVVKTVVNMEGKNFLHIAVEFEEVEIVKRCMRAKDIPEDVLNHKDKEGNTPFHIAALTGNEPLTRCFLFDKRVDKTIKNNKGEKALHAIKFPYDKRKAEVIGIAATLDQSDLKDESDFDLVVGALIATVSFTAGITVPGGYISDGPNRGTAVFSENVSFAAFIITNSFALILSFFAVICHFCAKRLIQDAHVIALLNVAKVCTLAAMCCMMAAFIAGSFAVLANSTWLAMVVCIVSCLFFILSCGPLGMIVRQSMSAASARKQYIQNINAVTGQTNSSSVGLLPIYNTPLSERL